MNLVRMKYFIDAAELENVTKAAEKNYISQTAMSQQIKKMEQEIGAPLFDRVNARVHLSREGQLCYKTCRQIVELYDDMLSEVQKMQGQSNGKIYVGMSASYVFEYFEIIFERFYRMFPNIEIIPVRCTVAEVRSKLESKEIDIGLSANFNLRDISGLCVFDLETDDIGLLVSVKNPLAQYDCVTLEQIKDEKIITTSPACGGMSYYQMKKNRSRMGYPPNICREVDSTEVLRMMLETNQGSTFMPRRRFLYNHKKCKMLTITDDTDSNTLSLGYWKNEDKPALDVLVDIIKKFFENEYDDWIERYSTQQ
jgi:DNA-binding transcriptional LysR family regulator